MSVPTYHFLGHGQTIGGISRSSIHRKNVLSFSIFRLSNGRGLVISKERGGQVLPSTYTVTHIYVRCCENEEQLLVYRLPVSFIQFL